DLVQPLIVNELYNNLLEVCAVTRTAFPGFGELEREAQIACLVLHDFHHSYSIYLPFTSLGAIPVTFIVAGMVEPKLRNTLTGERSHPWEDFRLWTKKKSRIRDCQSRRNASPRTQCPRRD